MGLLSSLGLKASQTSQADKAKADSLKTQFGKDFKSAVVQATRLRDQKAKADLAKELKAADAELRKADKIRNPTQRAQAMQAALDKVNASAKKAGESERAAKPAAPPQDLGQAAQAKPNGKSPEDTQTTEAKKKPAERKVPAAGRMVLRSPRTNRAPPTKPRKSGGWARPSRRPKGARAALARSPPR